MLGFTWESQISLSELWSADFRFWMNVVAVLCRFSSTSELFPPNSDRFLIYRDRGVLTFIILVLILMFWCLSKDHIQPSLGQNLYVHFCPFPYISKLLQPKINRFWWKIILRLKYRHLLDNRPTILLEVWNVINVIKAKCKHLITACKLKQIAKTATSWADR